ncbi:MAG: PQQ-dependent sugar dehydrogenase [Gaiellaceae bacterium]
MLIVVCATVAVVGGGAPVQAQEADPPAVGLRPVADGFTSPVALVSAGDGSGRLFVVDQVGLIRVLRPDGTLEPEPFLDLRSRMVSLMPEFDERGLLGLAFHPRYASNGRFFAYYSAPLRAGAPAGFDHTARISEFRVSAADPDRADPGSERVVLEVDEPQFNHNGGTLLFGPDDGDLYISLGDGGGANDVGLGHVADWFADNGGGNGQDVTENLLGSILRIDVDAGTPYGIPPDNPFAGSPGLDEVWAYGFRNPYRMSFDSGGTHQLFVGDVGQNSWEEVSIVSAGGNYGWNVKEGTHCFDAENPNQEPATCPDVVGAGHPRTGDPLIDPIIEYPQARLGGPGVAVVGGHVYRGSALPQFRGRYLFGDWSRSFGQPNGSLFVAKPRKSGLWNMQELRVATSPTGRLNARLLGFGQDAAGELYVLTTNNTGPTGTTGRVLKLVRPSGG